MQFLSSYIKLLQRTKNALKGYYSMESGINSTLNPRKGTTGFTVYVDLFNKGDFNEIQVIPENKDYRVIFDDIKLATITKNADNSWIKVDGNIPREKLEQVGNMISLRINSFKE